MEIKLLPTPFASNESYGNNNTPSSFTLEYKSNKWTATLKEDSSNFISFIIEHLGNDKKEKSEISVPIQFSIKFENGFEHQFIKNLTSDNLIIERIPFYYEFNSLQFVKIIYNFIPFLPVQCDEIYNSFYFSAICSYFMLNYQKSGKIKENYFQAIKILESLKFRPISIDKFLFYLSNFSKEFSMIFQSDFSLYECSEPTFQEIISLIILNYFSPLFNVKLNCFEKKEENHQNLSYLSKINADSIGLVFLYPSTYRIDEKFQIKCDQKNNDRNYSLCSMIASEGNHFACFYYSIELNEGFKFSNGKCVPISRDKWPINSSIISIFIRNDQLQKQQNNNFILHKNYYDQIISVNTYHFQSINDKNIYKIINDEIQGKNPSNFFIENFKTSRFSALSHQNTLVFPSNKFDDSCILITNPS